MDDDNNNNNKRLLYGKYDVRRDIILNTISLSKLNSGGYAVRMIFVKNIIENTMVKYRRVLRHSVRALSRRAYSVPTPLSFFPSPIESAQNADRKTRKPKKKMIENQFMIRVQIFSYGYAAVGTAKTS